MDFCCYFYQSQDDVMNYFLAVVSGNDRDPKMVCNLLLNDLFQVLNALKLDISDRLG